MVAVYSTKNEGTIYYLTSLFNFLGKFFLNFPVPL